MSSGPSSYPSGLRPSPYQLVALTKLVSSGLRGILICDGVGVGKTISAGYVASYVPGLERRPTLVVSPVMLVDKWREELQSKFEIDARPIRNPEELNTAEDELQYLSSPSSVVYILAQSLLLRQDFETSIRPGLLILDEIHNYRNPDTISYRVLQRLSKTTRWSVGLTATPINNTLDDLVSELSLVLPNWNHLLIEAHLKA